MVPESVERHRDKRKKRKAARKQRKKVEEAVQYALAHHTRLEILILLNEAAYTTREISELTGIELKLVSNHLLEMLDDGSVEIAKKRSIKGTLIRWYRAVELPEYTKAQAEAMTERELQMIAGVIVQSGTAELMAALHKGHLATPRSVLSWDLYDLDEQGRADVEDASTDYLDRLREIQCESLSRVIESKEPTTSMIVNLAAFRRARKIRVPLSRCKPSCDI
jgi:DNA-binding transcriptional ArsR family regulator